MSIHRSQIFSPEDLPEAPSQYAFPTAGRAPAATSAEKIASEFKRMAALMRLPLAVETDALSPSSFFGSTTPCVTAAHPDPPRSYYGLVIEVPKPERRHEWKRVAFWLRGSSSALDVIPGVRMESVRSRITDEALFKRPEDWTIVPELDYYQRLFETLQRALRSLA